jgi:hypothetical protein
MLVCKMTPYVNVSLLHFFDSCMKKDTSMYRVAVLLFTYRLLLFSTYQHASIGLINYHISNNILHVTEEELLRVEALSLTQEWLRNSVGWCEHMEKLKLRNFLYS